jgi:hypothetical protein
MVPIGDDTDNTDYVLEDSEETLLVIWKEEPPPGNTHLWINQGQVSVAPTLMSEPGSGYRYSHIAGNSAESLFGHSANVRPNWPFPQSGNDLSVVFP